MSFKVISVEVESLFRPFQPRLEEEKNKFEWNLNVIFTAWSSSIRVGGWHSLRAFSQLWRQEIMKGGYMIKLK